MNKPERIDKISTAAKKMWEHFRKYRPDLIRTLISSGRNKKFILNGFRMNSIEYMMGSILTELNLEWEYEIPFTFNNKSYVVDFYIKKYNLIIECFGDYWHANPLYFKSSDNIFKTRIAENIWNYDYIKESEFTKNKFKFLKFWETNIKENSEKIKKSIYEKLR